MLKICLPVFVFNGCRYVVVIGCDAMELLLSIWYSFDLVSCNKYEGQPEAS